MGTQTTIMPRAGQTVAKDQRFRVGNFIRIGRKELSRKAFVFGANGPADANPLTYALLDAERVANTLAGGRCKFTVSRPPVDASANEVVYALNVECELCTPEDTFVCYFSGHGYLPGGKLKLLLDSSRAEKPLTSYVAVEDIVKAMTSCRAASKLLVLDCCHAGAVIDADGFKSAIETSVPVADLHVEPENYVILMASDRLEMARELDEYKGSFLTHYFCEALSDSHELADKDKDNRISIEDLRRWLDECAKNHNRIFPHKKVYIPYIFGRQRGEFYLSGPDELFMPFEIRLWNLDFVVVPVRMGEMALLLSKYLITNEIFMAAARSGAVRTPIGETFVDQRWVGPFEPWKDKDFNHPNQPVVCVNLEDARRFAFWFSLHCDTKIRFSVPDSGVWDYAAFGTETPPTNFRSWSDSQRQFHHMASRPAQIEKDGSRTNERGLSDLIGNVWEWCDASYISEIEISLVATEERRRVPFFYRSIQSPFDVIGDEHDANSRYRSYGELRGGSYLDNVLAIRLFLESTALSNGIDTRHSDLGFRLQAEVPLNSLPAAISEMLNQVPELGLYRPRRKIYRPRRKNS
jgi:formylglycine-generating enzyme required for sulfatase activity